MAAASQLLIPINFVVLTLGFTASILLLEIFTSYRVYEKILKWLCLFLLAYVLALFLSQASFLELAKATFLPKFEWSFEYFFIITGILGTSISPYMFFWETSQEVEEEKIRHVRKIHNQPLISAKYLQEINWDNLLGMASSQFTAFCIIAVSAVVLFKHNITDIKTAADAAAALEPLVAHFPYAGFLAKLIFSLGIIGLGLLAIPVLAGSAAYAISEAFNWHEGLNRKLKHAKGFYGVIIISTLFGALLNLFGLDPIKLLIATAVINGLIAIPLIYIIIRVSNNPRIMGEHVNGKVINFFLYLTLIVMSLSAVVMFLTIKI
jgi:Mn2+/Fe2+ NRAMP family transporter